MQTRNILRFLLISLFFTKGLLAEFTGRIEGQVTLEKNKQPVHFATVMIVELSKVRETNEAGFFEFDLPPGSYSVIAYTTLLTSPSQVIEVRKGQTHTLNIELELSPLKHEITVTTNGLQQTAFESVQSVNSLNVIDLARNHAPGIGDVLDNTLGVAKRSLSPGSSRPVIRGFDGDRILVMQNGIRSGSLASQSADHGEAIDSTSLERIEILKGPATLLYGSNAIGGVVNAVSGHHEIHSEAHQGTRGRISSVIGSANDHLGASFNAEHGAGNWYFWGGGGGQRTDNYNTPEGSIENSNSNISSANAGLGYFQEKSFASMGYSFKEGGFGIPFASQFHGHGEGVKVAFHQHNLRFTGAVRNIDSWIDSFHLSLNYSDFGQKEIEIVGEEHHDEEHHDEEHQEELGATLAQNKQFIYRGVFHQNRWRNHSGSFGFWGLVRDYDVTGEHAFAPSVDQNSFAIFSLQELSFERFKLQFGGRLEHTSYKPLESLPQHHMHEDEEHEDEEHDRPDRNFIGFSSGIGIRVDTWSGGAFITNFVTSSRAPALEDLYNLGPHLGNLIYEIGNPDLKRERSNGFDFSIRHQSKKVRAEGNFFYYDIDNFIFLAPSDQIKNDFIEANYDQGDSRFVGAELGLNIGLSDRVWINFGVDTVDAKLKINDQSLPRIPPLRARLGLDFLYKGFSFHPELVTTNSKREIFQTETPTGGYTVLNLQASYSIPRQHSQHNFSLEIFNVGDKLYRNHLSFIKDLAPEIGRGVSLAYTMEFF